MIITGKDSGQKKDSVITTIQTFYMKNMGIVKGILKLILSEEE